ncbi:MAG: IS1 family transposase, partial [Spirochaetota bacterium]|nr:IS1 family transposase [Spirochaetota bacterium]
YFKMKFYSTKSLCKTSNYKKRAILYTDLWESYKAVLPSKRHIAVDKSSEETCHIERFNNTICQRCSNLARKTLSFSKLLEFHKIKIYNFIEYYNHGLSV